MPPTGPTGPTGTESVPEYPVRWPGRRALIMAGLRYQRMRWAGIIAMARGGCPACPKVWLGQHKFGCNRPGVLPGMRKIRRMDREGI